MNQPPPVSVLVGKSTNSGLPGEPAAATTPAGGTVADLRVDGAVLAQVQALLRTAADRLSPVVRTLQGLDPEAAGAAVLAGKLQDAQELLAADIGITGQALAELAAHATAIHTAFTQTDRQLGRAAGAAG
jgi:hypothetical protein